MKTRACNTCPFRKNCKTIGAADWLSDVVRGLIHGNFHHSCHKTDPKADGYVGHKEGKESICMGIVGMMKAFNGSITDSRVVHAIAQKKLTFEDISTKDLFQNPEEMFMHHFKKISPKEAAEIQLKQAIKRNSQ